MPGFQRFRNAMATMSDIEMMDRIRKVQFDLAKLGLRNAVETDVWNVIFFDR
ncbi:integrase [Robbsia andropogonis]|uniref:Integrase n=1 Tax=Robbsia andropogonis TaxID=28092 RepID=A0A0F5K4R1_9BURK|nr:integrase [Robbsia andropogonis]